MTQQPGPHDFYLLSQQEAQNQGTRQEPQGGATCIACPSGDVLQSRGYWYAYHTAPSISALWSDNNCSGAEPPPEHLELHQCHGTRGHRLSRQCGSNEDSYSTAVQVAYEPSSCTRRATEAFGTNKVSVLTDRCELHHTRPPSGSQDGLPSTTRCFGAPDRQGGVQSTDRRLNGYLTVSHLGHQDEHRRSENGFTDTQGFLHETDGPLCELGESTNFLKDHAPSLISYAPIRGQIHDGYRRNLTTGHRKSPAGSLLFDYDTTNALRPTSGSICNTPAWSRKPVRRDDTTASAIHETVAALQFASIPEMKSATFRSITGISTDGKASSFYSAIPVSVLPSSPVALTNIEVVPETYAGYPQHSIRPAQFTNDGIQRPQPRIWLYVSWALP